MEILSEFYRRYAQEDLIPCFINMYEMVMRQVASVLGNMGDYDRSDELCRRIIIESLLVRRMHAIYGCIYGIRWNGEQRQKKALPGHRRDLNKELWYCITLSSLCKAKREEEFYRTKINDVFPGWEKSHLAD